MKTRISAPAHLSATGGRVSGLVKLYATRLLNSLSQSVSLFVTKFSYLFILKIVRQQQKKKVSYTTTYHYGPVFEVSIEMYESMQFDRMVQLG